MHSAKRLLKWTKNETDQRHTYNICSSLSESLDEIASSRLRNPSQVINELVAGHTHAAILNCERTRIGIGLKFDFRGRFRGGIIVRNRQESLLVACISSIGNQLRKCVEK